MRVARLYAVRNAPERPRVADPERRRRIAEYLTGGTTIGRDHGPAVLHTDGQWLWPERFVAEVLDEGLAPEPDLLARMHAHAYRPAAPAPGDALNDEVMRAWRAGPPAEPRQLITYFVRVSSDTTVERPLSLLRRTVTAAGGVTEEAVWRDLAWHPTNAFMSQRIDDELREVTPPQAAAVLDRWCATWHQEALNRTASRR
ncbi:hypothetical protein Dvina_05270 [Dactylosporangium vinaceum]|uniref:Uncharacterized protein n=1 Tax=Dactylosporangium vinaceum TaxID=53362 RepID=A0ABV5MIC5_9ACTN|nr:hypothetical protein [Dactylosporangium vinaceum]UAB97562.1 hypothetical protein Dvina_05270 [Dactylosporangium vinaceum]